MQWTLEELGERVQEALTSTDYVPPSSGRVRAVPDARTIRYYTTLGLVDPCELRGRTAYYGRRHLMQLVAIKRLQAEGLSLRRVQELLGGLDDAALADVARLPEGALRPSAAVGLVDGLVEVGAGPAARREDFWSSRPAAAPPPPVALPAPPAPAAELRGLELCEDLTLLVRAGRALTDADRSALRRAAGPLLDELRRRGLIRAAQDERDDDTQEDTRERSPE
ncbi:MAG: MerR family transcriptional regulator [Planctomycetota bacterium]